MNTKTIDPPAASPSSQSSARITPYPYPWPFPWPGPYGPWPGPFDPPFLLRGFACGVGALHGMLVRRIVEETKRAGGDSEEIMRSRLSELLSQGLVTERDAKHLGQIIQACSTGNSLPHAELMNRLHRTYNSMLDNREASAVALAIASIAVDSAQSDTSAERGIWGKDAEGALSGAAIGAGVGGVGGAVVGGLIGGAIMSIGAALDQLKSDK